MAYIVALPTLISNLLDFFHVSQMRKYIHDSSHVIQVDGVQVRENLIVGASPLRVEDHKVKHLRCKEIALVKVVWGGLAGESTTWELGDRMRDSYSELLSSSNFLGQKFYK